MRSHLNSSLDEISYKLEFNWDPDIVIDNKIKNLMKLIKNVHKIKYDDEEQTHIED